MVEKKLTLEKKDNENWHWMLNKSIMIVETNSHIKASIDELYLFLW
jgi:hypothetical protein